MVAINSFLRIFIYFFCNPQFRYQIITNFRYFCNKTKSIVHCEENCAASNEENSSSNTAAAAVGGGGLDSPIVFEDAENVQLHSSEETPKRSSRKNRNGSRAERGSVTFDTSTSTKTGDTCYL